MTTENGTDIGWNTCLCMPTGYATPHRQALDDILSGPASAYLLADARTEQTQLTQRCRDGEWQHEAVTCLKLALDQLGIECEAVPARTDMRRWFRLMAVLRNKTRGHGATRPEPAGLAAPHLARSIETFYQNFSIFERSWCYLYRNLSGKYRVSIIGGDSAPFEHLKRERNHHSKTAFTSNLIHPGLCL